MPRLIFDIETIGSDFDSLDEKSKELLLAYAKTPEEEQEKKETLSLSPLTGSIVTIGILNPDTNKGAVYFHDPSEKLERKSVNDIQYTPLASEKEVLKEFWDTAQLYDQFITFNGHAFDCPYLMIRSAILKVKPSRNLMLYRFSPPGGPHLDLIDRMTNFGAFRPRGSLHLWCQAFGIKSPKEDGVAGDDVAQLFKEKKYLDIAQYCAGDLWATKELLDYWDKYINLK
ncbi:MAG: ribonuclease H-like domain-containing protein [Candidatus Yanofskybacteria bacterium]|nr:ribonuclease H-like domain-containing protein [Candidatus Yanofskybacteria bacterium]